MSGVLFRFIRFKPESQNQSFWKLVVIVLALSLSMLGCISQEDLSEPDPEDPTPASTLPELIQGLASEQDVVRVVSANAIADMGPTAESAVPYLIENLSARNSEVRISAIQALGEIQSREAVEPLQDLLDDDYVHIRRAAVIALGKIADRATVPALVPILDDEDSIVSGEAARAIERITGVDFPETDDAGVYVLTAEGVPVEVVAAKDWWNKIGENIDW